MLAESIGNATAEAETAAYHPPLVRGNPMVSVLQSAIGRMESASRIHESLALAYWPRVVGAQAAAATEVESVRDGVLIVRTRSSVWSHELMLHKARLLLGLNRLLGGKVIHDIIFRAQGVSRKQSTPEPEMPTPEELDAVILEPGEKAELGVHLSNLASLENSIIREKIAHRLILEAKLRHWRLERGWRICPRCSAPHKTAQNICPLCRLRK